MTSTDTAEALGEWRHRHQQLSAAWQQINELGRARDLALVERWTAHCKEMHDTRRRLLGRGAWRSGPRTLLAALDLQYRELSMTAGLAWLLRPDGHHGLGDAVLVRLRHELGIETEEPTAAPRIELEEARDKTRADLVVYGADWTLVVEAKTFAVEQPGQLDRLYHHWQDEEAPHFVFLTRGARAQKSARESHGHWQSLTWRRVAALVRDATATRTSAAPGVFDYLSTLEDYHRV